MGTNIITKPKTLIVPLLKKFYIQKIKQINCIVGYNKPSYALDNTLITTSVNTVLIIPAKLNVPQSLNFNFSKSTNLAKSDLLSSKQKSFWFLSKFKYHGKGLKIKKSKNQRQIIYNLGSSHISKLVYNPANIAILRTKKNTYSIMSYNKVNCITSTLVKKIRPYNQYTKRGLRAAQQSIIRRFGKVSQIAPKKK